MSVKELCPNCIELTDYEEETIVIREDRNCIVRKIVRYCKCCRFELAACTTLKLKPKPT